MTVSEQEKATIQAKVRCHRILNDALDTIAAEGLTEHFGDSLVDVLATHRFVDASKIDQAVLHRLGEVLSRRSKNRR